MLLRRLRALQVARGTTCAEMSSGLNGELGGSATVDINSIGAASGGRPSPAPPVRETVKGRSAVVKKLGVDPEYYYRPGPWDEKSLGSLLDANKAWARKMRDQGLFQNKSKGHAPKILWIGCSDARVPANEIIGEAPGSVFVHRNIANQVVHTDFNCMSVIQYAVDVLRVKHVIVCGHYDCGGVKAALVNTDHKSPLENWLRNIRQLHQNYFPEIRKLKDPTERQRKLVEINTIEQCLNIFKTGVVQRRRVSSYLESLKPDSGISFSEPVVHAMVYDPSNGELKKLDVDFKKYLSEYSDVFNLYTTQSVSEEDGIEENEYLERRAWGEPNEQAGYKSVSDILHDSLVDEGKIDSDKIIDGPNN